MSHMNWSSAAWIFLKKKSRKLGLLESALGASWRNIWSMMGCTNSTNKYVKEAAKKLKRKVKTSLFFSPRVSLKSWSISFILYDEGLEKSFSAISNAFNAEPRTKLSATVHTQKLLGSDSSCFI